MTNTPRPTRNERREEAREAARVAREKAQKRQSLMKWLIPTVSSIAILAIVGGVIWAVIAFQPAPKNEAGPANMGSDGIVFAATDGEVAPVATPAIAKGETPTATEPREGLLNIVTFVDYTCPSCKNFEEAYGPAIDSLVEQGVATLEIRPVAILGPNAVRAANVVACVADGAPEKFLDVHYAMFTAQGGASGSNAYVDLVRGTGLANPEIESCIRGESFTPWVETATARSEIRATPTVVVNGTQWMAQEQPDFTAFLTAELEKLNS